MKHLAKAANIKFISMGILFSISMSFSGVAQKLDKNDSIKVSQYRHSINMCPLAVAFGIYSANFEYMVKSNHGIVLRGDYEAIPKTYSDANIEPYGYSFILNYRYHFKPQMNSLFAGAYTRYRVFKGEGTMEGTDFDFERPDFTIGLNAGKRWVWSSGFNITFALGYGYSWHSREANPGTPEIEDAIDVFENEYDFMNPFYGEFSIGYSF